ncbi:deoxynucleoside kinase [Vagococcus xieshaowenii]|uniref:Deoxynucleoside kinase n=2 Tax=Vagococcus xieshaowenii TaxID=2562451 RepID=A0AAJ5EF53_9ENTE|nr:deoxynucleoside kinase [Vagococcus xieshaowenii]QCA28558.1 deoxynucleoside kinase [Vagococcus xieshaowenii]TFZ40634.1 deoxynucleoside kinase [Vagococcus xieshaowenii]
MVMIVVGGMIGLGKTSVATILGEHLKSDVFFEKVEGNDILPLFYTASPEEQEAKRYPFLLQLDFLQSRFKDIKRALVHPHNVLDRSIYEDWYFAKVNNELGRISDIEFKLYEKLLENMMEELDELPKKAPDLMIYLKGSFETVLSRIAERGRDFEQDDELRDYYYALWKGYDQWVMEQYKASEVLIVNMDEMDVVNSKEDRAMFIQQVDEVLKKMDLI